MKKIPVGLLGCTGLVGQTYIHLLSSHPYFELVFLGGSNRSSGMIYKEAVQKSWFHKSPIPKGIQNKVIESSSDIESANKCALIFSALPSNVALELDILLAKEGVFVVSHASCHRKHPLIPLIISEINPHHLSLISEQKKYFGPQFGGLVAKPNCSLQSYLLPLFPIMQASQISAINVTTLQSLSGAGTKGIASLNINPEVTPFIEGEEEKSESEPLKILGKIFNNKIIPIEELPLNVQCIRTPTIKGHFACVSFQMKDPLSLNDIQELWHSFSPSKEVLTLPSSPSSLLHYHKSKSAPIANTCLSDFDMRIHIGQLKKKSNSYRFVALSDNITRGAAGGGLQIAELAFNKGYLNDSDQSSSHRTSRLLSISKDCT